MKQLKAFREIFDFDVHMTTNVNRATESHVEVKAEELEAF